MVIGSRKRRLKEICFQLYGKTPEWFLVMIIREYSSEKTHRRYPIKDTACAYSG